MERTVKEIGITNNGGHLLELSEEELEVFHRLKAATGDFDTPWIARIPGRDFGNLAPMLKIILAWVEFKFALVDIERMTADMRKSLGETNAPAVHQTPDL
jgi:hypothetical protein